MDIRQLLQKNYIRDLIGNVCGKDAVLLSRKNSFCFRRTVEGERDIHRVIMLPPRGFTANAIDQMNSHDEAEYATIRINGAVKPTKRAFSKLKDCLLIASSYENGSVSELNQPYLTFNIQGDNNPDLCLKRHSSGTAPFPVVKSNGFGFYHNLINVTDEWLVLTLHKRLRPQRSVNLKPHLTNLSSKETHAIKALYVAIVDHGDGIFKKTPHLIEAVMNIAPQNSLPALGEMLYVHDSGMHEACTAFAIILKIGNQAPNVTLSFLKKAMQKKSIPDYYTQQLLEKIDRKQSLSFPLKHVSVQ